MLSVRDQALLGDDDEAEGKLATIHSETRDKLAALGDAGLAKPKQVLQFVTDLAYKKVGGQQLTCKCMFCFRTINSTGATRVVDHFVECVLCPKEVKEPCMAMRDGTASKRKAKEESTTMAAEERDLVLVQMKAQKTEMRQMGIKAGFKAAEASVADEAIAKFFYANGVTFGAARDVSSGSYYKEMVAAIQAAPPGYVPPNAKTLAGPMIDVCYNSMSADIGKRDQNGEMTRKFGSAYTSDGWESCDHLPLINSAIITAADGGVYIRSVDTSGHTKNAEYCAALMIADIYEVGCTKVVMLITDTCNVMQKAWAIVEDEFPWISCVPCQTHCPSLLLTDISKLKEPAETIKEESVVVGWFTNHQKPLAILRDKVKQAFKGKSCELKKAGATRMGTNTFVGERLEELKGCLQQTVVDPEYVKENYKDLPAEQDTSNCGTVTREHKGGLAKKLVLDDADKGFWGRIASHVKITMPVCKMLRRFDSSAPAAGKVYHSWYDVGESIKESDATYATDAQAKHEGRWAYAHAPFFAAAYVCDPEFINHDQLSCEEVQEGLNETLEKIGILLKVRTLADKDSSFAVKWAARKKAIEADPLAQKKWDDFPNYPDSKDRDVADFCTSVTNQLAVYRQKRGVFARAWIMSAAKGMPAHLWWDQHGGSVPELQAFARLVTAQPASASICERINCEFEFVKDRRRNRLSHDKANKLVALFHNLRLLKRMRDPQYSEPTIAWSEDLEHSAVTKYQPAASSGRSSLLKATESPLSLTGPTPTATGPSHLALT